MPYLIFIVDIDNRLVESQDKILIACDPVAVSISLKTKTEFQLQDDQTTSDDFA